MRLGDLYWLSNEKFQDKTAEEEYEMPGFDEIWNALVKTQYTLDSNSDCSYDDPTIWAPGNWCLQKDGLYIGAYFPRVMRACDTDFTWPIIPYQVLEKYRVNQEKYTLK